MARRGSGPVRDEGASEVSAEEQYGPQGEWIIRLVAQCDKLEPDQIVAMAQAHRNLGINRGAWEAWTAARRTSALREEQAGASSQAVEYAIKLNAIFIEDEDIRSACGWAASDAGLAVSTRDLVGSHGYTQFDFEKLMSAWKAGAEPE